MKVLKFNSKFDLFAYATDQLLALMSNKAKEHCNIALCGGSTAQAFFEYLAQNISSEDVKKARFFIGDERIVDFSSEYSNSGNAWRHLIEPLGISRDNFFPLSDARKYEEQLKDLLETNSSGIPVFDLIYIGLGEDGHTASLFPHSKLMKNLEHDKRLVAPSEEICAGFERLTYMPRLILASQRICMITTGSAKTKVLEYLLKAPYDPESYPSQIILNSNHKGLSVLTCL